MTAFHLAEDAEKAVHVERLKEDVNVGGGGFSSKLAKGDIAGIAEDGDLAGAFGFGKVFEGVEQLAVVAVTDIDDEQIGVVGFDQFQRMIGGSGARHIMPKFPKQTARWRIVGLGVTGR